MLSVLVLARARAHTARAHAHPAAFRACRACTPAPGKEEEEERTTTALEFGLLYFYERGNIGEPASFAALLTCYTPLPFMLPFNQKLRVSSYT